MKSFKQFREEGYDDNRKEKNTKPKTKKLKNKKSGNVEVMPSIPDGKNGMTTRATNESFETGVAKARRDYRSGPLLNFKQFMAKITDILDEWEK